MKVKSKFSLILKRTAAVIWWLAVVLLAFLLANIIGAKMQGKVPSIFGYSVINIVSGSMEDEIPKGSYILIKKAEAEQIKCGDIICFYSSDPIIYGLPNTHRVVEEPIVSERGIEFITRGDANHANDNVTAKGDRLIGVYVKRLDGLTSFSEFISGNAMIIVIISLQLCIISLLVYSFVKAKTTKESAENGEDKEQ